MRHPANPRTLSPLTLQKIRGGALILAVGMIAVLSLAAAVVCRATIQRHRACFQEASWGESLAAAEAGADIAIAALRSGSWTGWSGPDTNGVRTYTTPVLSHGGEGNTRFYAVVAVDSPPSFTTSDGTFYRIRSTGTARLSGGTAVAGQDKLDNELWKLSLKRNRDTGAAVTGAGLVSRTIEVIARPGSRFPRAITLTNSIHSNSSSSSLDSFDSSDPAKSTNGVYDPTKRQQNAKIGSIDSTGSDLNGMQIHGDVIYSGPAIPGTEGVTGRVITPFYDDIPPVKKPAWMTVDGSYGSVNGDTSLVSGPTGSPTRYKMSAINLGSGAMTMLPPAAGQPGEVEIWVTGDLKVSGDAQIITEAGVKVTIYFEGNAAVTGTAFVNRNSKAANVTLAGVTPADGSSREFKFTGGADFTAGIYAPAYDVKLGGNGTYTGAFVAKTLTVGGSNAAIHYDEALGRTGGGSQYTVANWAEDIR